MRKTLHYKLFISLTVAILMGIPLFAQISAYHGIVFPYDARSRQLLTFGEISAAIPDAISGLQINPAGLIYFQNLQFHAALHQEMIKDKLDFNGADSSGANSDHHFYPSGASGSLPFNMFGKEIVVAITGNYVPSAEFDLWETLIENELLQYEHTQAGNVWNTSFGVSSCLFDNLSIGISMTKWWGSWSWQDGIILNYANGTGEFKYSGSSFTLGLMHRFKNISLGLSLYSPFTLMKSKQIRIMQGVIETANDMEQYFTGAARFGILFRANPQLTFGAGYRYQGRIVINDQTDSEYLGNVKNTYGESHQISLGIEQTLIFKTRQLPIFMAYQGTQMPKVQNRFFYDQYFSFQNEKNFSHNVILGSNIQFRSLGLYLSTQWNYRPIKVILNELVPPYS
jgi:hypothetical protein